MTTRRIAYVLTVMLLPWLTSCDLSLGLSDFSIETRAVPINLTGTVTAAEDGTPLAGVTIQRVFGVSGGEAAISDSSGRYSLTAEGRCIVSTGCNLLPWFVAHLDGFERGREPTAQGLELQGSAPELDATLDFSLRPTRPITVTVQGQVTDASNGAPIQGALITVREGSSFLVGPVRLTRHPRIRRVRTKLRPQISAE